MDLNFESLKWNKGIVAIVFLILGLILLIWPIEALSIASKLIALVLLIGGIGEIVYFLANKDNRTNTDMLYLIISIIVIGISISIFVNPIWLIATINIVVGIGLILSAISNITNILAIRTNDSIWWSFAIVPIITLILGFVIIINPVGMASFMTRIEGISLILDAVSTWIVMYRIKKFLD